MRVVGIALWVLGLCIFMFAFLYYDPTVAMAASADNISPYSNFDRVVNTQKLQVQMLSALLGLTFFLSGVIVHSISTLRCANPRNET